MYKLLPLQVKVFNVIYLLEFLIYVTEHCSTHFKDGAWESDIQIPWKLHITIFTGYPPGYFSVVHPYFQYRNQNPMWHNPTQVNSKMISTLFPAGKIRLQLRKARSTKMTYSSITFLHAIPKDIFLWCIHIFNKEVRIPCGTIQFKWIQKWKIPFLLQVKSDIILSTIKTCVLCYTYLIYLYCVLQFFRNIQIKKLNNGCKIILICRVFQCIETRGR